MTSNLPATIQSLGIENSNAIEKAISDLLPAPVRKALWPEYGPGYSVARYRVAGDLTAAEIDAGIATIEACHIPADTAFIGKELTRVLLATKARETGEAELRMKIAVYIEELSDLPADAIRAGCRHWARTQTFAPSLAELRAACLGHCNDRRLIMAALKNAKWRLERLGSARSM